MKSIIAFIVATVSLAPSSAVAGSTLPESLRSERSILVCSERGGRVSLWKLDLASKRRTRILDRSTATASNGIKFYGTSFQDDCRVTISSNLRWEVGTDAIYRGNLVRRDIRTGRLIRLKYDDTSSDFYGTDLYTVSYTICGPGNGTVFSLGSDGTLYRQESTQLVPMGQTVAEPTNGSIPFLTCLNNKVAVGALTGGDGGSYPTFEYLDGQEISIDQFGGRCSSLVYSGIGRCPEAPNNTTPGWYARIGNNRYFLFAKSGGIGLWGCSDPSAFTNCSPKLLLRNLPAQFNPGFARVQGFIKNGKSTLLTSRA